MKTLILTIMAMVLCNSVFADEQAVRNDCSFLLNADKATLLNAIQKNVNTSPAIVLAVTSKARLTVLNDEIKRIGKYLITMNIVFGIDRGYGYSVGPFPGEIDLYPVGPNNVVWYDIVVPPGLGGNIYSISARRILDQNHSW